IEANRRDPGWDRRNGDVVDTRFDIEVPSNARLDIETFSSEIDVRGVSGAQHLKTFSGDIIADAIAAGESPDLDAQTFSGEIRARLADSVKGEVRFNSFSGQLNTDL